MVCEPTKGGIIMSKRTRRRAIWTAFIVVLAGMVIFDLTMTHSRRGYITLSGGVRPTLADRPVVALATSQDLSPPVPLDSPELTYEQVKELIYLALDRDQSSGALSSVVGPDDWVAIKVNMVVAPLVVDGKKRTSFWIGREKDIPHWGTVTDLRVVKAVIAYLIERVGPKRISIVEGSGEVVRTGSPNFPSYAVDGWTCTWEAFDNLSYAGIVEAFNAAQSKTTVDIVDLLDDELVLVDVPGGGLQLLGGRTRGWGWEDYMPGYGTPRGSWYVPRAVLECDQFIDVPTLKTTGPGITVFMKNYVGVVGIRAYGAGPVKTSVIDNVAIMPGYMDFVKIRPPDYCLAAGFWSSDGWYGSTYDINHNVVIAGQNVVASEAVAARIMGFNPRDLQQILLARDLGLGSFEESDYEVVGGDPSQQVYRFPGNRGFTPSGFQDFLMLGPFDEADIEMDLLGDEAHTVGAPGEEVAGKTWWTYFHRPGYPEPYTDFSHLDLGDLNGKTLYAFLYIDSDRAQDGFVKFGSDGPARIWLNGELLVSADPSSYSKRAPGVHLDQGRNTLLVKVAGTARGAGFGINVVGGPGSPLRMLTDMRPVVPQPATAVSDDQARVRLPASVTLTPGFPNPFNAAITVPFALPRESPVRVTVLSLTGQTLRVLWDHVAAAGKHQVQWDGTDSLGRRMASGLYLIRLEAGDTVHVQKVTLMK